VSSRNLSCWELATWKFTTESEVSTNLGGVRFVFLPLHEPNLGLWIWWPNPLFREQSRELKFAKEFSHDLSFAYSKFDSVVCSWTVPNGMKLLFQFWEDLGSTSRDLRRRSTCNAGIFKDPWIFTLLHQEKLDILITSSFIERPICSWLSCVLYWGPAGCHFR
jgi:hypothetical protein